MKLVFSRTPASEHSDAVTAAELSLFEPLASIASGSDLLGLHEHDSLVIQGPGQMASSRAPTRRVSSASARSSSPAPPRTDCASTRRRRSVCADFEVEQFDRGIRDVARAHHSATHRLDAALRYVVTYLDERMGAYSIGADPAFALTSLAKNLGSQVETLARELGDALDEVPSVRSGTLSREETAEMFLRLAYSHCLVPHSNPAALLSSIRAFAGLNKN